MKIITLNTWGGRINKELLEFLSVHSDTEVFCLQEVFNKEPKETMQQGDRDANLQLFEDIQKVLPNHSGYFRSHYGETYGLAAFVKDGIKVVSEGECFVYKHKGFDPGEETGNHPRNVQSLIVEKNGKKLTIFNFHGLWTGGGKTDTDSRLEQSAKLVDYIKNFEGPKVLCGDFNLLPDTESLKIVENIPLKNLVKEYGIKSTRTSYYDKEHRFADYILVSSDITVKDFKVLPDEVSDHSPLYVEID